MITNDFETIKNRMKNAFIKNMIKKGMYDLTDLNEGSIAMSLFESIANVLEEVYIDVRMGFQTNLNHIATSIFGFSKKQGLNASAFISFTRAKALDSDIIIPSGTIVSDGSHNFVTTKNAIINANKTVSNLVSCQAEKIGIEYNVQANTITQIVSIVSSQIISVTNPNPAIGGADTESESDMMARFKLYINGLQGTNYYGLKAGILSNPKVRSVSIVEHKNPSSIYNVTVYVDDGTDNMSDALRRELEDIVNGDGSPEHPGLRAAGINIAIEPCTPVSIDISAKVTLYRVEEAYADAELKEKLESVINSFEVSEDVLFADILTQLKQAGSFVKNVKELKLNNQPNTDIIIAENQIARLGKVQFEWENE